MDQVGLTVQCFIITQLLCFFCSKTKPNHCGKMYQFRLKRVVSQLLSVSVLCIMKVEMKLQRNLQLTFNQLFVSWRGASVCALLEDWSYRVGDLLQPPSQCQCNLDLLYSSSTGSFAFLAVSVPLPMDNVQKPCVRMCVVERLVDPNAGHVG